MAQTDNPGYSQNSSGPGNAPHVTVINGKPSGLAMMDSAGIEYLVWVDTTGDLRVGTRAQYESQSGAGVVGSQS